MCVKHYTPLNIPHEIVKFHLKQATLLFAMKIKFIQKQRSIKLSEIFPIFTIIITISKSLQKHFWYNMYYSSLEKNKKEWHRILCMGKACNGPVFEGTICTIFDIRAREEIHGFVVRAKKT